MPFTPLTTPSCSTVHQFFDRNPAPIVLRVGMRADATKHGLVLELDGLANDEQHAWRSSLSVLVLLHRFSWTENDDGPCLHLGMRRPNVRLVETEQQPFTRP